MLRPWSGLRDAFLPDHASPVAGQFYAWIDRFRSTGLCEPLRCEIRLPCPERTGWSPSNEKQGAVCTHLPLCNSKRRWVEAHGGRSPAPLWSRSTTIHGERSNAKPPRPKPPAGTEATIAWLEPDWWIHPRCHTCKVGAALHEHWSISSKSAVNHQGTIGAAIGASV